MRATTKTSAIFAADFETTVSTNIETQEETRVWAAGFTNILNDDEDKVRTFTNIRDFMINLVNLPYSRITCYFHNLKFDGAFIINYLIYNSKLKQGFKTKETKYGFKKTKDLRNSEFTYMISEMGTWYGIELRYNNKLILFKDSLKLLPFPLRKIGESFKTKHQKLEMEYSGERGPGYLMTKDEEKYLKNDILVLAEALKMFIVDDDNKKSTIASCALSKYKKMIGNDEFKKLFPENYHDTPYIFNDKTDMCKLLKSDCMDHFVRKAYKGGWVYVNPKKQLREVYNGCCADVNSLFPSMMHSDSGNKLPYGDPIWFKNNIPKEIKDDDNYYYFVMIKCKFKLKEGKLPCVQIQGNGFFPAREWATSCEYFSHTYQKKKETIVELVLTKTDYELMKENYDFSYEEVIGGCYFKAKAGIFDCYINYYSEIKQREKGAKRQIAKLFLNSLYGKFGSKEAADCKIVVPNTDGVLKFETITKTKEPLFVPIAAAITSYARRFTIKAAEANLEHFCYADTDSIHCDCHPEELKNVPIHDTKFNHWKIENTFERAFYTRAKTYIEVINDKDKDSYIIRAAGLPEDGKKKFIKDLIDGNKEITSFKEGLSIDEAKLRAVQIKGGVLLTPTTWSIK